MIRKDNLRYGLLTLPSSEYRLGIIEAFFRVAGPASSPPNIRMKLTPKYNFVFPHQSPERQSDGPNLTRSAC